MNTTTDTRPAWRSAEDIEDDLVHETCDDDIAVCGEYVPGDDWAGDEEPVSCPMCAETIFCPLCGARRDDE